jgi:hypothetical protein
MFFDGVSDVSLFVRLGQADAGKPSVSEKCHRTDEHGQKNQRPYASRTGAQRQEKNAGTDSGPEKA